MANTNPPAATPQANEQTIFNYFYNLFRSTKYGFTPQQAEIAAAGVVGNAQVESSFNPNSYNSGEGALGIFQWEGGRGPNGSLAAFAKDIGSPINSLRAQLRFATSEIQNGYSRVVPALKSASSPTQAAAAWATIFEGNNPSSNPTREADAERAYAAVVGGHPLTGGPSSSSPITTTAPTGGAGGGAGIGSGLGTTQANLTGIMSAPGGPWDPLNWPGELIGGVGSAAGAAGSAVLTGVEGWVNTLIQPVIHFFADVTAVILGLVLLVLAFKLIADSSGDNPAPTVVNEEADDEGGEDNESKSDRAGAGAGAGDEAAEVAAA